MAAVRTSASCVHGPQASRKPIQNAAAEPKKAGPESGPTLLYLFLMLVGVSPSETIAPWAAAVGAPTAACIREVSVSFRVLFPVSGSGLSASATPSSTFSLSDWSSTYSPTLGGPGSGRTAVILSWTSPLPQRTHGSSRRPSIRQAYRSWISLQHAARLQPLMAFSSPSTLAAPAIANNHSENYSRVVEFGANRAPGSTFVVSTTLAVYSCWCLPPSFRRQCPWGSLEELIFMKLPSQTGRCHHQAFPPPQPFD